MSSLGMQRIRPVDAVLAGVLCLLGVVLAVMNIEATDGATRIDSHSWLQLPLFVAAVLTVLWWRSSLIGVLLVSSALMLVHVLAFGHLVRCGAGLPLAFVLSFLCGFGYPKRQDRVMGRVGVTVVVHALDE